MTWKRLLYVAVILFTASNCASARSSLTAIRANEGNLQRLDSVIMEHESIIQRKESRINDLRDKFYCAASPDSLLDLSFELFDEYLVYNADSAFHYASMASRLASVACSGDYDTMARCRINLAFVNASLGFREDAIKILDHIDSQNLSRQTRALFYQTAEFVYSICAIYAETNRNKSSEFIGKANLYRDSLSIVYSPEYQTALWAPIAISISTGRPLAAPGAVERLKMYVDTNTVNSRDAAINSYWMARYYKSIGDDECYLRYLIDSAVHDAEIENREIMSIEELAIYLFKAGEVTRPYDYLIYSNEQANAYHNRNRMVSLSNVLPMVRSAYGMQLAERDRRLGHLWLAVGLLALLLVAAVVYVYIGRGRINRLYRRQKDLEEELRHRMLSDCE